MSFKMKTGDEKKCEHVVVDNDYHFVYIEKKTIPSLKLVHMYPDMYPRFTVDPGALKFVLKGANIMCPGLTNEFGSM
jgi:PUA domain protein